MIDEKVKLIGECLKEEYSITDLSRKTIYKWLNRYHVAGLEARNKHGMVALS